MRLIAFWIVNERLIDGYQFITLALPIAYSVQLHLSVLLLFYNSSWLPLRILRRSEMDRRKTLESALMQSAWNCAEHCDPENENLINWIPGNSSRFFFLVVLSFIFPLSAHLSLSLCLSNHLNLARSKEWVRRERVLSYTKSKTQSKCCFLLENIPLDADI